MLQCDFFKDLNIHHGFATRQNGVSLAPYESLNCGFACGDDPDHVAKNRAIALSRAGMENWKLFVPTQTHSATALIVDCPGDSDVKTRPADALVSQCADIAVGVITADCAPILLVDPDREIVAAAHAGWKGALRGIVASTIDAMEKCGAKRPDIRAVS